MTRTIPQSLVTPDIGPVLDYWLKQTEFALYVQSQTMQAMLAPLSLFSVKPPVTAKPAAKVEAVQPAAKVEAAKPAAKAEAAKPFVKVETAKPAAKAEAAKPAAKVEAAKPAAKVEAAKPAAKVEAAKPAAKVEAAKPAAKVEAAKPAAKVEAAKPAAKVETAKPAAKVEAAKPAAKVAKPVALKAPRGGKGDDLTAIKGVGPKLAKALNDAGLWHFDQIAALTPAECAWIDDNITGVRKRASRDDWPAQARALHQ